MTIEKPFVADRPATFAKARPVQLAMRETLAFVNQRKFWVILGGAVLLAALAGPFYSLERMGFGMRLVYFGLIAVFATLMMTGLAMLALQFDPSRRVHWALTAILMALVGLFPLVALVYLANHVITGQASANGFFSLTPYVAGPLVVINLIVNGMRSTVGPPVRQKDETQAPAPLLFDKVPPALGREIISLEAQDHYIEVTTTQGKALVLMRLSDAERDLAALRGQRVHRSWWLNLDYVDRLERGATGGVTVITADGRAVPVSRAQQAQLRSALSDRQPTRAPTSAKA